MKRTAAAVSLAICLIASLPSWAGKTKTLVPVPSEGQETLTEDQAKHKILCCVGELKNGLWVSARIEWRKKAGLFYAVILIRNWGNENISVRQDRFFLLNKYDRVIHRLSEYEIKRAWAEYANLPPPPPPPDAPPPRSATVYGSDGTTSHIEEDNWAKAESGMRKLGWGIGAALGRRKRRKKAEKQIELIEQNYFRDRVLQPGEDVRGWVDFKVIATSHKAPVTLVLFIEGEQFRFVFQEQNAK